MRFFCEMTQNRIALQLGLSQMHVSRLIIRTCARLRDQVMAEAHEGSVTTIGGTGGVGAGPGKGVGQDPRPSRGSEPSMRARATSARRRLWERA
jgi:hypothetical protein